MIKPLDFRIHPIGFCLAVATLAAPVALAGSYSGSAGASGYETQREIVRRQQNIVLAQSLIQKGDRALAKNDYATAYDSYLQALDLIGTGPAVTAERNEALNKFSQTGVAYAQYLIDRGQYSDAEKVAKTVLLPEYNPTYRPAIVLLSHLEQPDYYNKTVTPSFADDRDTVSKLLVEAEGYYSTGRYDLAVKRYNQVLNIDRYNIAAQKGIEKVSQGKSQYDLTARNETRARMLWEVTQGWQLPTPKYQHGKDTTESQTTGDVSHTEAMTAKLNRIIIPSLNLDDTTIRDAVNYLRQLSVKYDTMETNPEKRGVNIFLKLAQASAGAGTGSDILPPLPATPDQSAATATAVPGASPAAATGNAAPVATEDTRITLDLNNIPLYEALRYVANLAGLKIKIDPVAVSLVPLTDVSSELITKEYKVPPNFIPKKEAAPAGGQTGGFGAAVATDPNTPRINVTQGAQEYLSGLGVQFPDGASAQYIPAGSKLVVRNTQDNIDFIDQLVDAATGAAPTQVEIQSKFVEINQNNLKELGFDWTLGAFSIGNGVYGSGGSQTATTSDTYPFSEPGSGVIGSDTVTAGLRNGVGAGPQAAIAQTSVDSLLQSATTGLTSGSAPGIFGIAGIFTNPQFQVVIRALNQKKGIDLMSAPTVTTKSGNKAVVNVIREFRYPTEFNPPQIPQTVNNNTGVATGFQTSPIITPTTPSAFDTRNLGVTLEVTPTVGADGYTIDLDLAPEVVDFDGFINYGTPIRGLASSSAFGQLAPPTSVIISPNVINQPIFSTRKVTTNVTIWDGMTISIGGLIREDVQKVQDKVPLLGDVPLVGRLFRSDVDQKLKKNLIIFVTATLLNAEGRPVRADNEQEEVVEPLGLPEEITPPAIQEKGLPAK
jgi:general secretion pathway protein D